MNKWKVFVSYAHEDSEIAKSVKNSLERYLCWSDVLIDTERIGEGGRISEYVTQLERGECNHFVLVCSRHSKNSWWVGFECGLAYKTLGSKRISLVRTGPRKWFDHFKLLLNLGEICDSGTGLEDYMVGVCHEINKPIQDQINEEYRRIEEGGFIRIPDERQSAVKSDQGKAQRIEWSPAHDGFIGKVLKVKHKLDEELCVVTDGGAAGELKWPVVWVQAH